MLQSNNQADQIEGFIELCNQLIQENGAIYAGTLTLGELFTAPKNPEALHFDPKTFTELQQLYEAANRMLYEQLCELKAQRTRLKFRALADEEIARIKAHQAQRRANRQDA